MQFEDVYLDVQLHKKLQFEFLFVTIFKTNWCYVTRRVIVIHRALLAGCLSALA